MILEGVVTTLGPAGLNVAPMGPRLFPPFVLSPGVRFALKPFAGSTTWANLRGHPEGVLHVTDDVLLLARAAVGKLTEKPATLPAVAIRGEILADACRAHEFRIVSVDDSSERIVLAAEVVRSVEIRPYFGLNRAMHAVVEAAILATRLHLLAPEFVASEFARLKVIVEKTAGPREAEAFALLDEVRAGGAT